MNNKEMLQEIKKRVDRLVGFESASDNDLYYISKKHINWLIEQAEKVEQLQDKLQRCQESYTYFNRTYDYWCNKAKQYEEELKEIAKYENWLGDDLGDRRLRLVGERAKQVLKGEIK